ncbi:hypothetical protein [Alienimonas californiensis]|uniref:Uncharacterized protein n=1 Tax=Alienimonas californiensis TaxID=2527989 RepID=A0A517P9S8_9PLAN|nr:hypothetical protein [Alienimonas californiensis]QDT16133.1 hypothetical protein CA12_22310 [Alienimonas californiensis]
MWCPSCRRDVAATADAGGPDGVGSAVCVSCGGPVVASRPTPAVTDEPPAAKRARELLDKWSHLFEEGGAARLAEDYERRDAGSPPRPQPQLQSAPASERVAAAVAVAERPRRTPTVRTQPPQWRFDDEHGTPAEAAAGRSSGNRAADAGAAVAPPHRVPTNAPRVHAGHAPGPAAPHFDPVAAGSFGGGPARNAGPLGQLLAYGGVLGLTVGGAFIVWSYFGGPPGYAPTGWLLTTAGQMLLFLGIVTLIAGGMDKTTHEVRTRIETLGGSLARIEQAQKQAMKAPHIPAEAFAEGTPATVKQRETASA